MLAGGVARRGRLPLGELNVSYEKPQWKETALRTQEAVCCRIVVESETVGSFEVNTGICPFPVSGDLVVEMPIGTVGVFGS